MSRVLGVKRPTWLPEAVAPVPSGHARADQGQSSVSSGESADPSTHRLGIGPCDRPLRRADLPIATIENDPLPLAALILESQSQLPVVSCAAGDLISAYGPDAETGRCQGGTTAPEHHESQQEHRLSRQQSQSVTNCSGPGTDRILAGFHEEPSTSAACVSSLPPGCCRSG